MGFAQAGVVAGEGKAVTSDRPRAGEKKGCDAPGSIDPAAGENGCWGAERRSVQRSRLRCSVPGMPVVGKAANRITWNHFFCSPHAGGLNSARLSRPRAAGRSEASRLFFHRAERRKGGAWPLQLRYYRL